MSPGVQREFNRLDSELKTANEAIAALLARVEQLETRKAGRPKKDVSGESD